MTKQIRFMGTNTNQSVTRDSDVQLNCFAQYYSEKVGTIEFSKSFIFVEIQGNGFTIFTENSLVFRTTTIE